MRQLSFRADLGWRQKRKLLNTNVMSKVSELHVYLQHHLKEYSFYVKTEVRIGIQIRIIKMIKYLIIL